MKKGATGSNYIIAGSGCVEHGMKPGKKRLPNAFATEQVKDKSLNTVCKADLISVSNREEARKAVVLIDRLLLPYRFAGV